MRERFQRIGAIELRGGRRDPDSQGNGKKTIRWATLGLATIFIAATASLSACSRSPATVTLPDIPKIPTAEQLPQVTPQNSADYRIASWAANTADEVSASDGDLSAVYGGLKKIKNRTIAGFVVGNVGYAIAGNALLKVGEGTYNSPAAAEQIINTLPMPVRAAAEVIVYDFWAVHAITQASNPYIADRRGEAQKDLARIKDPDIRSNAQDGVEEALHNDSQESNKVLDVFENKAQDGERAIYAKEVAGRQALNEKAKAAETYRLAA